MSENCPNYSNSKENYREKVFVLTLFVVFASVGCDNEQNMMKSVITIEPELVVPASIPVRYRSADDFKEVIVFLTVEAALNSKQYANVIAHTRQYNVENCNKIEWEKERLDSDVLIGHYIFYLADFEIADSFRQVAIAGEKVRPSKIDDIPEEYEVPLPEELDPYSVVAFSPKCY